MGKPVSLIDAVRTVCSDSVHVPDGDMTGEAFRIVTSTEPISRLDCNSGRDGNQTLASHDVLTTENGATE